MNVELLTKTDLQQLKADIVEEIRLILTDSTNANEWLKTTEVKAILGCSSGTLQNLRIRGKLKCTKVNGTVYYNRKEVMDLFK
jgi:hypothetical protein